MGNYLMGTIVMDSNKAMLAEPVIQLNQVFLGWRSRVAVRDVTGSFYPGSMTAVVGPNGAGKSTLIRAIMGQISPLRGQVKLLGEARKSIACMPQAEGLDSSFPITVYDLVAMGAWQRVGAFKSFNSHEHEKILEALEQVGLADFSRRIIGTLSGGQLQRALFARLIMHDAQVLLLDEPFAAVDRATTEDLLNILCKWHEQGRTVIVVLHDLDIVRKFFPQALLLAGQVVDWGPVDTVLTPENLHMARHLCAGDF